MDTPTTPTCEATGEPCRYQRDSDERGPFIACVECGCPPPAPVPEPRPTLTPEQKADIDAVFATVGKPHDCDENAVPYTNSGGALGHGWECGVCGAFLQAG